VAVVYALQLEAAQLCAAFSTVFGQMRIPIKLHAHKLLLGLFPDFRSKFWHCDDGHQLQQLRFPKRER